MKIERVSTIPSGEIFPRMGAAAEAAAEAGLSGLLLFQNVDLYYFAGTAQKGALYIPADPGAGPAVFFVIKDEDRARAESPFLEIVPISKLRELPESLSRKGHDHLARIGLELDVLPTKTYLFINELFPGAQLVDASSLIRRVRAVKSPFEKKMIRHSARQLVSLFAAIPSFFAPGVREIDIAARSEFHLRGVGHEGLLRLRGFGQELFFGVVVSGPSGAVPSSMDGPVAGLGLSAALPQGASPRLIGDNEPILVDMVGARGGYLADGARLYYRKTLPQKAIEAFDASLAIQHAVVSLARPGIEAGSLFEAAESIARESGFQDNFMGIGRRRLSYIGHGVGLEVDELPVIARGSHEILEEGNVFALEPKFIFLDIGAVGLENTFYLGVAGPELLTEAPEEPTMVG